uniref:Uncharacterized protein n=1 Tax=Neisseria meningitidis alpha153 TaxID=663926 RepID=C6SAJ9_NEIME|nr:hypothetical protein predicted by Glimmer/Critica [Neisseria meningitidis alpha153]
MRRNLLQRVVSGGLRVVSAPNTQPSRQRQIPRRHPARQSIGGHRNVQYRQTPCRY